MAEMRNVTCASCGLASDCHYARQIGREWNVDRARENPRVERGCALSREEIRGLLRACLGCPVAFEWFLLDFRTHCPLPWETISENNLQRWASAFIRGWDADLQSLKVGALRDDFTTTTIQDLEDFCPAVRGDLPFYRIKIALFRYLFAMDGEYLRDERLARLLERYPAVRIIWEDVGRRISDVKVRTFFELAREGQDLRLMGGWVAIEEYFTFLRGVKGDSPEIRATIRGYFNCIESFVNYNTALDREEITGIIATNPILAPILDQMDLIPR